MNKINSLPPLFGISAVTARSANGTERPRRARPRLACVEEVIATGDIGIVAVEVDAPHARIRRQLFPWHRKDITSLSPVHTPQPPAHLLPRPLRLCPVEGFGDLIVRAAVRASRGAAFAVLAAAEEANVDRHHLGILFCRPRQIVPYCARPQIGHGAGHGCNNHSRRGKARI